MGLVGWGAGSFDASYILSLTPSKQNNQLVDNQLMQQCVIAKWVATAGAPAPSPSSSVAATAAAPPATASQVTVTSRPVVMTTLQPTATAAAPATGGVPESIGDATWTMTMSMVTGTAGGDGDGEGLLTASGSPTPSARATQVASGENNGGLETASGSPNATGQNTSPSGSGVVTASGAQGTRRFSAWVTLLAISVGLVVSCI